jgi:uncharacterized protein (DUF1800 family)
MLCLGHDPPAAALAERMAKTFTRPVMATMLESDEFWAETTYRTKMKFPLEMVASVRALGAEVDYTDAPAARIAEAGRTLSGRSVLSAQNKAASVSESPLASAGGHPAHVHRGVSDKPISVEIRTG